MSLSAGIFYFIAAFTLVTAFLAVTSTKIFRAAIWLLSSLVGIAAVYFWLQVEFIAAVQIIVYVGGIVVLIIFSIFLTQDSGKVLPHPTMKRKIFSLLAVLLGFAFSYNLVANHGFPSVSTQGFAPTVADYGTRLLSTTENGYILPFEVVSMLLLAAMIGCIVIAMRSPEAEKNEHLVYELRPPEEPAKAPEPEVLVTPFVEPITPEVS
jgi:NADH-quinone oxidoreductase subunit J